MLPAPKPPVQKSPLNPLGRTPESQDVESGAIDHARETLNELDPLLQDERFKKFWARKLKGEFETQTKIALDPKTLPRARTMAVWKREFLKNLYESPMLEHAAALDRLKAAGVRTVLRDGQPPQVL